jgi:hypothetical protein
MAEAQPSEELKANFRTPATNDFPKGANVGERLPDFTLPDQFGKQLNYDEARGDGRALVMFHRSARW